MEAGGGALAGIRGEGFTLVESVGWGFFTLLSLGMLVWVCRNTFLANIIRDSMNKQKAEMYARYRELAATKEHLYHHIAWSKQDGDIQGAEKMAAELKEVEEECRKLALILGRKRRKQQ